MTTSGKMASSSSLTELAGRHRHTHTHTHTLGRERKKKGDFWSFEAKEYGIFFLLLLVVVVVAASQIGEGQGYLTRCPGWRRRRWWW
jgi:hypothetical protein